MLYYVELINEEGQVESAAQHSNQYLALLMATMSMYAKATAANFKSQSYGACESFYPPHALINLQDYLEDIGFQVEWQQVESSDKAHGHFDWP